MKTVSQYEARTMQAIRQASMARLAGAIPGLAASDVFDAAAGVSACRTP